MQKNLKSVLIIGVLSLVVVGCASVQRRDSTQFNVIPFSEVIDNPSKWQDIGTALNDGKTVIFKVAQGQRVPLKLTMDIPVGTIEKSENTLSFNREVYLLMSKTNWQVSPDGQRWASLGSMRSLKKLFGFSKGQLSVGVQGTKDDGTFISVDLKAK
jgi:hypothetical protein